VKKNDEGNLQKEYLGFTSALLFGGQYLFDYIYECLPE
jgi:hypothetical protein